MTRRRFDTEQPQHERHFYRLSHADDPRPTYSDLLRHPIPMSCTRTLSARQVKDLVRFILLLTVGISVRSACEDLWSAPRPGVTRQRSELPVIGEVIGELRRYRYVGGTDVRLPVVAG